jgi:uncharacterized GH25 family protein
MKRCVTTLLLLALAAVPVQAHFIWIVPEGTGGTKAKVIFSEGLEPDEAVPVEKIAATRLHVRNGDGKVAAIDWNKGEHAYLVSVPEKGPAVLGGVCQYGVIQRGEGKPFLLAYYPKLICGEVTAAKPWDKLALEIVPQGAETFQVLFGGKPVADTEVVVLPPASDRKETLKTDAKGEFMIRFAKPGLYGIRARHVEAKAGEYEGKKYEEVRHYATLVFRVAERQAEKATAKELDYAPLPRAISSFGAAIADGWLYVYGGHCGNAHEYSTDDVLGTFRRLNLKDGKTWEDLPAGPALQGLAMVAYKGKLYRIGGMQPKNKPGEKADNHSLATCACYDPASKKWEELPDLPEGRSSHDAVVVDDKLYVVGGWKMNGADKKSDWHSTALVLDLTKKPLKWKSIKQPFQRRALTAGSHGGKVYVIAGLTDKRETTLTVNVYDPAKDAWATGPNIPGPQSNGFTPASCVVGGRLYVSTADGKLHRLSEKGDTWEPAGELKQPRYVHRMVTPSDNLLLVIGGASKTGNVAFTEAIRPRATR